MAPLLLQYIIRSDAFSDATNDQLRYGKLINICQNYALRKRYNLSAYTEIEYCIRPAQPAPLDGLDIGFLVISALILVLVIASTWYDYRTKSPQGNEHYKKDVPCRSRYPERRTFRLSSTLTSPGSGFSASRNDDTYFVLVGAQLVPVGEPLEGPAERGSQVFPGHTLLHLLSRGGRPLQRSV